MDKSDFWENVEFCLIDWLGKTLARTKRVL